MSRQSNVANIYGIVTDTMIMSGLVVLKASMNGFWIRCKGETAMDINVPLGLPEGFTCVLFNENPGVTIFINQSAPGVQIHSVGGLHSCIEQYGEVGIFSYAPNRFKLTGNLA